MTLEIDVETAADQAIDPEDVSAPKIEALFPEAEHHQRFRRFRLASLAAVILIGGGTAWGVVANAGGNDAPPFGLSSAAFGSSVGYAMSHARTARIAVTEDEDPGSDCIARQQPIYSGLVNFTESTILLQSLPASCGAQDDFRTEGEIVDGKGYVLSPSVTRSGKRGPDVWHTLLGSAENAISSDTPVGQDISTRPWKMLNAITGPLQRVGVATIRDTETTEYRGSASLASVLATYPALRHTLNGLSTQTPLSQLIVPASKVHIPVLVWLDSQHRIRRLELSEPSYRADIPHTNGAMYPGFDLPPTVSVSKVIGQGSTTPSQRETVHLTNLRVGFIVRVEVDLYDFGTPVHVTAPKTDHVAAG